MQLTKETANIRAGQGHETAMHAQNTNPKPVKPSRVLSVSEEAAGDEAGEEGRVQKTLCACKELIPTQR
jgi:hypothetical protein